MILQLFFPILGTLLAYMVFHVVQFLYHDLTSPLRRIMVGPSSPSLLVGNFMQMMGDAMLTDKWRREFGPNFVFKGLFSVRELHTSDIKAISHIIGRPAVYQKAPFSLYGAKQLFGPGLLGVELEDHRRQRRVMNPAFGVAQIRQVAEISVEKAIKLRDIWNAKITDDQHAPTVEVFSWLRRMTLDVIGEAGFNYHIDNLDDKPNELSEVLTQLSHSPTSQRNANFRVVQAMVPFLRLIPLPGRQVLLNARAKMFSIGRALLEQSKLKAAKETARNPPLSGRRDLLSLIVKANMTTNIPDGQRLSDEEVIGQIPTFFLAGHETTSSAIAWALHSLSLNQDAQTRLREEVLAVSSEDPTMDELNQLVYLECVVRENMRINAPIVFTTRMAMQDDVLPLGKPYVDKTGRIHDSLPIREGQMIHIPILAVNTDEEIWGEDSKEFKPERWENVPKATDQIPGMWANLLTFFAGPHNCIGFRFSLVEQKALLFTLIRAFVFENAVPKGGIGRSSTALQRPIVLADRNKNGQMPLIVKRYRGC
ncbi:cytochrome P450 [Mycena galopus ATCC 62051]|nr:cytochrome P450 [Mycena galopus ATCC 62051]